jgi:hypothetical protein
MADVIFTAEEKKLLSRQDMAILRAHVLHHIQTSPEIRQIISGLDEKARKRLVDKVHPRIRTVLRSHAEPLFHRLKRKAQPGTAGGGRKKGGRKKSR